MGKKKGLDDPLRWDKRERVVAGPGDNRSRAKARRLAKKMGNRIKRRKHNINDD